MKNQILGFGLICVAAALLWTIGLTDIFNKRKLGPPATFGEYISRDLAQSYKDGSLPPQWGLIQKIKYRDLSEANKQIIQKDELAIPTQPAGQYELEIETLDVSDDQKPKIILQMSLFDMRSNNKIWELGKTYSYEQFTSQFKKSANK